jgi:hypothetical protein
MIPSFERTSSLVARGLSTTRDELLANWREAHAGDVPAIIALREATAGKQERWDDAQYLSWRYGLGTTRRAYARYRILVHKGEVIAGIGAEEFTLRSPAGNIAAACPMDLVSLPEYRNLGLGPWLNQALFQQYPLVLALGANANSLGLVSRMYSLLPGRREFKFPVDLAPFLRRRIRNPLLYALISPIAMVAARTRGVWMTRHFPRRRQQLKHLSGFDATLDAALAHDTAASRISIMRSADYLNWRYCDNPRTSYRVLGMYESDALIGYVVYRTSSPSREPCHAQVADWWIAAAAPADTLSAFVGALLADTHQFRPAFVGATALGESDHEQLRRAGFISRSGDHNATGYHCEEPGLLAAIQSYRSWRLTDLGKDDDGMD